MYNSSAVGAAANTVFGSRTFRYEVVGLRQSSDDRTNYPIRQSGSTFINVPYSRMNEFMQRITRLGGKIVSIQPVTADSKINGNVTPEQKETAVQVETGKGNQPGAEKPMTQAKAKTDIPVNIYRPMPPLWDGSFQMNHSFKKAALVFASTSSLIFPPGICVIWKVKVLGLFRLVQIKTASLKSYGSIRSRLLDMGMTWMTSLFLSACGSLNIPTQRQKKRYTAFALLTLHI